MKKPKSNYDLVHEFATNEFNSSKSNSYGNLSYIGDKIYSYGHHCIGRKTSERRIYLVDFNYSMTTSKHNSLLSSAVSHYERIYMNSPNDVIYSIIYLLKRCHDARLKFEESKINHKNKYLSILESSKIKIKTLLVLEDIRSFSCHIGLESVEPIYQYLNSAEFQEKAGEVKQYQLKRILEQKPKKEFHENEILEKWRIGKINYLPRLILDRNIFQFLRIKDQYIETSKGVKIPLEKGLQFAKLYLDGVNLEGRTIENFHIDKQDENLIKIGCHRLPKTEIQNLFQSV